jgi:hypothetical protein
LRGEDARGGDAEETRRRRETDDAETTTLSSAHRVVATRTTDDDFIDLAPRGTDAHAIRSTNRQARARPHARCRRRRGSREGCGLVDEAVIACPSVRRRMTARMGSRVVCVWCD